VHTLLGRPVKYLIERVGDLRARLNNHAQKCILLYIIQVGALEFRM